MSDAPPELLVPAWEAPRGVRACFTTRRGGGGRAPYDGFNLATHVGDDADVVARNRARLCAAAGLPRMPVWLEQVHGAEVAVLDGAAGIPRADAALTRRPGLPCAVLVADCVPVLLAARDGSAVAAVHAGWRGLAAGVVAGAVAAFGMPAAALVAWIGPRIGVRAYRVGEELRDRFVAADPGARGAFAACADGWHLDLARLTGRALAAAGVTRVALSAHCVHAERDRFFSHRRDGTTGRMAALVWIAA